MRKFLLAITTVASASSFSSGVFAADVAPVPSAYDWSGVYIGLNAGVAWSNSEVDGRLSCSPEFPGACDIFDDIADDFRHGVDDSGGVFSGGAMIGANWQWESLVLGVEADVNYANFGDSSSRTFSSESIGQFRPGTWTTNAEYDANWWGTVRARAGFAADNWLFYGTGGLAWGNIDANARVEFCPTDFACSSSRGSESDTNVGWTIGAGMEYGWDQWTFGAEYLYVDLGDGDLDHNGSVGGFLKGVTLSGDANIDYQFSVVRATAKWKF